MRKDERDAFDRKVLQYVRAKRTVCVNQVARHFGKKWETANTSVSRLVKKGLIFYHPEMGDNPCFYSIWRDTKGLAVLNDTPITEPDIEKREEKRESNDIYARSDPLWARADTPDKMVERGGFVCHPSVDAKKVPSTFVRGHMHGQYTVHILNVGNTPSTFRVPDTEITGGWTYRSMGAAGNKCYYGHIKFPEDREKFKFHSMADKNNNLTTLCVYVHPRFIYYVGNAGTAMIEFDQQVRDVLHVLEQYGWRFDTQIKQKGTYSMGYNNRSYAEQMPTNHIEKDTDPVKFDSSPGSSDKGCTEAEIYFDHTTAEQEIEVLVEHPQRIIRLEANAEDQNQRINALDSRLDKLITVAERNVQLTELTMSMSMGIPPRELTNPETLRNPPVSARREDVMYG